jgi:hypothetical protein
MTSDTEIYRNPSRHSTPSLAELGAALFGTVPPRELSDDEVESLAVGAGMEGHRTYMSPPDFHHWCDTMRAFLVAARAAA